MFDTMKAKVLGAGLGLALVGSAIGGVALTGLTSAGAQTTPNTPVTQSQPADAPGTETPEGAPSATDAAEANEPQLPGGGNADANGVDVQNDFQGVQ